jgi:hypothetical protein
MGTSRHPYENKPYIPIEHQDGDKPPSLQK